MALYEIDNRYTPIDFECNKDVLSRTIQNVKNLIMCRKGEVFYDRMRGIHPAIFDLPIAEANTYIMQEVDRVLAYEPDAEAVSAEIVRESNGDTIIKVVVEINL